VSAFGRSFGNPFWKHFAAYAYLAFQQYRVKLEWATGALPLSSFGEQPQLADLEETSVAIQVERSLALPYSRPF
jgi:hypothetical protein